MKTKTGFNLAAFADALEFTMVDRRLTMNEAAAQCGVASSTICRIRHGRRPDIDSFFRLIGWLGIPADKFSLNQDNALRASGAAEGALWLSGRFEASEQARSSLKRLVSACMAFAKSVHSADGAVSRGR
jgi:transcriptional regulator with XRE-family HTH domain